MGWQVNSEPDSPALYSWLAISLILSLITAPNFSQAAGSTELNFCVDEMRDGGFCGIDFDGRYAKLLCRKNGFADVREITTGPNAQDDVEW